MTNIIFHYETDTDVPTDTKEGGSESVKGYIKLGEVCSTLDLVTVSHSVGCKTHADYEQNSALTYISERWQAAAGKWVCGAQTEKTHCSQTRAAALRWAGRNTHSTQR